MLNKSCTVLSQCTLEVLKWSRFIDATCAVYPYPPTEHKSDNPCFSDLGLVIVDGRGTDLTCQISWQDSKKRRDNQCNRLDEERLAQLPPPPCQSSSED